MINITRISFKKENDNLSSLQVKIVTAWNVCIHLLCSDITLWITINYCFFIIFSMKKICNSWKTAKDSSLLKKIKLVGEWKHEVDWNIPDDKKKRGK